MNQRVSKYILLARIHVGWGGGRSKEGEEVPSDP